MVSKPKVNPRTKALRKLFKPLLLLPILAIAALLVYFFVPVLITIKGVVIALRLYSLILLAVVGGLVALYVLVRLVSFILEGRRIKKQEELLGKAEVLRILQGLDERWKSVESLFRSAHVGLYDIPWYLVLGNPSADAPALLQGSGLSFPEMEEAQALGADKDVIDRWSFTNEAVFIDTSGRAMKEFEKDLEKAEWEALLSLLSRQRPRCPINGVLLLVSAFDLAMGSPEDRKAAATQMMAKLRHIQSFLNIRLPSYLIVTQVERLLGFSEFFRGVEPQQQILGWSNPHPPTTEFSLAMLDQAFAELAASLKERRLLKLGGDLSQDALHRALLFPDEFADLAKPLAEIAEPLFRYNRFDEPTLFRGIYFTAGHRASELITLHCQRHLPPNVLELVANSAETKAEASLFCQDLFTEKILRETNMVSRPRPVMRRNLRLKTVGALATAALVVLGSIFLVLHARDSADMVKRMEDNLQAAQTALKTPEDDQNMLALATRLSSHEEDLAKKGMVSRVLSLGKYDDLDQELGTIHRGVVQETLFKSIVERVETDLNRWRGRRDEGDARFPHFAAALAEYTRWSNPTFPLDAPIDILPFLNFLDVPLKTKYQYVEQFRLYLERGGRSKRITSPSAEEVIGHALASARLYLRPTMPEDSPMEITDAQWWLKLSHQLQTIRQSYQALLKARIPDQETPGVELLNLFSLYHGLLTQILSLRQAMSQHIGVGEGSKVSWIDVDKLYNGLEEASQGMNLGRILRKDRKEVGKNYKDRVVEPIARLAPIINMLKNDPSQSWMVDLLVKEAGLTTLDTDPDFGAGHGVQDLLGRSQAYNDLIEEFTTSFERWKAETPLYLSNLANQNSPLRTRDFLRRKNGVEQSVQAFKELTSPAEAAPGMPAAPPPMPLEEDKEEDPQAVKRKAIVAFWAAPTLIALTGRWLEAQERVQMLMESRYLEELFRRGSFQQGILEARTWQAIKNIEIFRNGDGLVLANPIDNYVAQWLKMIPPTIMAVAKGDPEAKPYPELAPMEELIKQVQEFKGTHLSKLRVAAGSFAGCVQAMDMDAGMAWQTLRDSPWNAEPTGQPVNWASFQALSRFKQALEEASGPICAEITRQMVQIENHIYNIYKEELIGLYQREKRQLFEKHSHHRGHFPFLIDGPQLSSTDLLRFFDDLNALQDHFELAQGLFKVNPDKSKAPLSAPAHDIINEMASGRVQRFFEDCRNLEAYLYEKRMPRPHKGKVVLIPGKVGTHFHWIRLSLGNGAVKDVNVYGQPQVELAMQSKDRSLNIFGLDAAKQPQAFAKVLKGDNSLLQMINLHGRPEDVARTTWQVSYELPMSEGLSHGVRFKLRFIFEEGLPELPVWEDTKY